MGIFSPLYTEFFSFASFEQAQQFLHAVKYLKAKKPRKYNWLVSTGSKKLQAGWQVSVTYDAGFMGLEDAAHYEELRALAKKTEEEPANG